MAQPAPSHPMPPVTLPGDNLLLRALAPDDWELEQELSRDPDVVRWTYYPPDLDEQASRDRIALSELRRERGELQRYAIVDANGAPLGTCGISNLHTETPEIFYALLAGARGRGVATEAAGLLTSWVLANGFERVSLDTLEGNTASERVAEKLGFRPGEPVEEEQRGETVLATQWIASTAAR